MNKWLEHVINWAKQAQRETDPDMIKFCLSEVRFGAEMAAMSQVAGVNVEDE
jgi:hypothetical protein